PRCRLRRWPARRPTTPVCIPSRCTPLDAIHNHWHSHGEIARQFGRVVTRRLTAELYSAAEGADCTHEMDLPQCAGAAAPADGWRTIIAAIARPPNRNVSSRNTSEKAITTPWRCVICMSCFKAMACASLPNDWKRWVSWLNASMAGTRDQVTA